MDFKVPDNGGSYLPKEIAKQVVDLAVEKALVLKLINANGGMVDVLNEKSVPVSGAADDDKMYYIEATSDVTTLTENSVTLKSVLVAPKELGGWFFLSDKDIRRYKALGSLEDFIKGKMSKSLGRTLQKVALVGDTTATGTSALQIANGIYTIAADSSLCSLSPVTFTTETTQGIVNAVIDAKEDLGAYAENNDNLVILAGSTFYSNSKKNASTLIIGFDLNDYPVLGLKRIPFIDGTPVIQRTDISAKNAVLCDIRGAKVGYEQAIKIEPERKAGKRGYNNIITVNADFAWAYLNSSNKNEGLVLIQDNAS